MYFHQADCATSRNREILNYSLQLPLFHRVRGDSRIFKCKALDKYKRITDEYTSDLPPPAMLDLYTTKVICHKIYIDNTKRNS